MSNYARMAKNGWKWHILNLDFEIQSIKNIKIGYVIKISALPNHTDECSCIN